MPLDVKSVAAACPSNRVIYKATTLSTMSDAAVLAAGNAEHGTVVVADEQTAGIGRLGRQWLSGLDEGIYCTILLRLKMPVAKLPVITLALGVAVAEAIAQATGLKCDLRWPNDVLINERKTAGILAQLTDGCVLAGIGINVNQTAMPEDLRTPATSLRIENRLEVQSREDILIHLLHAVDGCVDMLIQHGPESILRAFLAASSYALHKRIVYETETGFGKGTTAGLDSNGFLLVRDENGGIRTIHTGGVRPDISA